MSVIRYIKRINVKKEEIRMKKQTHTGTIDEMMMSLLFQKIIIELSKMKSISLNDCFIVPEIKTKQIIYNANLNLHKYEVYEYYQSIK